MKVILEEESSNSAGIDSEGYTEGRRAVSHLVSIPGKKKWCLQADFIWDYLSLNNVPHSCTIPQTLVVSSMHSLTLFIDNQTWILFGEAICVDKMHTFPICLQQKVALGPQLWPTRHSSQKLRIGGMVLLVWYRDQPSFLLPPASNTNTMLGMEWHLKILRKCAGV